MERFRNLLEFQAPSVGVAMANERCETYRISPFDDKCAKLRKVFDYFLYRAPGINSSLAAQMKEEVDQDRVTMELCDLARKGSKSPEMRICNRNSFKLDLAASGTIDFSKPYIYCNKRNREEKLSCLLRHLRNALAHGNVFIKFLRNDTLICFQDFDVDRSKARRISALIVVNRASLERWMKRVDKL